MPVVLTDCSKILRRSLAQGLLLAAALQPAWATDFSVSPILVSLKPGAMSETITVANHAKERLRVNIKLMAWTQDADGKDVYAESSDLVYFPRQLDIDPESKKIVRLGLKSPAGASERAYRLFVEEVPDVGGTTARAAVNFNFRFGVPVFVPPVAAGNGCEVGEPRLEKGKVSIPVRNDGNEHVRLLPLKVSDGADTVQAITAWYSLPGTARTYTADIPAEACRKAKVLNVTAEGEGLSVQRQLNVDPANCA